MTPWPSTEMVPKLSTRNRRRSRTTYHFHAHRPHVSVKNLQSSIRWEADFAILISALLVVVQLHYQGSSPLRSHPAEIWTFMLCLFTYCIARRCYVNSQVSTPAAATIYQEVSAKVAFISGSLASAALISILVSSSLEPIVFIICLMFLFLYFARNPILHMGQKAFSYVKRKWEEINGSSDEPATIVRA